VLRKDLVFQSRRHHAGFDQPRVRSAW